MTELPKRKIEDRAIGVLKDLIDQHPTMDPHIKRGDKDMSWDGFIRIFKDGETNSDKRNFDADIPIQVKGHIIDSGKKTWKNGIQAPVSIDDLNVYFRASGCLYFQIYISEDGEDKRVYYNALYPSKIKTYLRFAKKKQNKKSYSIPFLPLKLTPTELEILCKQYATETRQQGFGAGQIISRMIDARSLVDVKEIHFTAIGVNNPHELMEKIARGDVVAYGSFEKDGVQFPIDWDERLSLSTDTRVNEGIYVAGQKYYDSFVWETSLENVGTTVKENIIECIKLSPNLCIQFFDKGIKLKFGLNTDILQLGHDAGFVLSFVNHNGFSIGTQHYVFSGTNITDAFEGSLNGLIELGTIFKDIGFKMMIPFGELTDDDKDQLDLLMQIKRGTRVFTTDKEVFVYNWVFRDKYFPFIIEKVNKNDQDTSGGVVLSEYMYNKALRISFGSPAEDNGEVLDFMPKDAYVVPNYYCMDSEHLANLYYYDYESMHSQIEYSVINDTTQESLVQLALNLIGAYDISKDDNLLDLSHVLLSRMIEVYPNAIGEMVNLMQIEKRRDGTISENSIRKIPDILDMAKDAEQIDKNSNTERIVRFCLAVLQDNVSESELIYKSLSEADRKYIDGFPIMKLYQDNASGSQDNS